MDYLIFLTIIFIFMFIIIKNIYQNNNNNNNKYDSKYNSKYNTTDKFINLTEKNVENDVTMNFNYLTDKNYTENILNTYYLNDDTKINNVRIVEHPFQKKLPYSNTYGNPDYNISRKITWSPSRNWGRGGPVGSGILLSSVNNWGNYSTFSDYIYNTYGVRR